MPSRLLFVSIYFIGLNLNGQTNLKVSPAFIALDKSYFKWNDYSMMKSFHEVKKTLDLSRVNVYDEDYFNFYCGRLSDSTKAYRVDNEFYQKFNNVDFDQVYLYVNGNTKSRFCTTSFRFFKDLGDSATAFQKYQQILQSFKSYLGKGVTESYQRFNADSQKVALAKHSYYTSSNENDPFSAAEETTWNGGDYFYAELYYIKEKDLLIFRVNGFGTVSFLRPSFLFESDYEEAHTEIFRDFDKSRGYKGLKFGSPLAALKSSLTLTGPDQFKQFEVKNDKYKTWFSILFDDCLLTFNKKKQLSEVSLSKYRYSREDYQAMIKEMTEMFGVPTEPMKPGDKTMTAQWFGMYMFISVVFTDNDGFIVMFESVEFDDFDKSDKLY